MSLYFAYGSNLDRRQMRRRCPTARVVSRAVLVGHELRFSGFSLTRQGPVATIVKAPKSATFGVVYEIDEDDLQELDRYEGAPRFYVRVKRKVGLPSGKSRTVWTYVLSDAAARKSPAPEYLGIIERSYRRLGFDVKQLRQIASSR